MSSQHSPFEQCREEWQRNAEADPLWVILCNEGRERGRWEEPAFFQTGRNEIDRVFAYMAAQGIQPARTGRFLDFGCGVGRLSRALIQRFDSGLGLDIAPRMIELATGYNASDPRQVEFRVNAQPDLSQVPSGSIDFVYSHLVLQHMPADLQTGFIGEFLRVLAPGGVAAFQIASGRRSTVREWLGSLLGARLKQAARRALGRPSPEWAAGVSMPMHVLDAAAVMALVSRGGCLIRAAPYSNSTDTGHNGEVDFFSRRVALERKRTGRSDSHLFSQFFFIARPENGGS